MTEASPEKRYCTRCLTTFEANPTQCPNLSCRRKTPRDGWGRIYEPGEVFDRNYRIHRMLAVGGAGVTYMARELGPVGDEVGPKLAVKVLLAARDQGPYVRRLATEAQIIQELDHPNIVQYLGFVHRAGHSPYLITRFEAGGSVLDHMRRVGTLSVKQTCVVGRQICWALEKAHERGIVHRDLKPENVLLARPVEGDEQPVVRVADFGIAKVQGSLGSGITRVGAFVGTPHYAAPEQFVGGAVSEAADVYSMSALLYFTLMARHVVRFADRLDPEDSFQLLSDNLPPQVVRDQDPMVDVERMNRVFSVSMQVDPARRCTVSELDAMLEAILADTDPKLPTPQRSLPTDDFAFGGGSVLGMAGAVDARGEATAADPALSPALNPAVAPLAPAPAPASGAALAAGAFVAGAAIAGAAAALSRRSGDPPAVSPSILDPTEAVEPPAPAGAPLPTREGLLDGGPDEGTQATIAPADDTMSDAAAPGAGESSGGGAGWIVAILLLGLIFVAGGVGGGWYLADNPDLLGSLQQRFGGDDTTRRITKGGGPADDRADWKAIALRVHAEKADLQRSCAVPDDLKVQVELEVTSDGAVQAAAASSGGSKGACVADQLRGMRFDRVGRGTVQLALNLAW